MSGHRSAVSADSALHLHSNNKTDNVARELFVRTEYRAPPPHQTSESAAVGGGTNESGAVTVSVDASGSFEAEFLLIMAEAAKQKAAAIAMLTPSTSSSARSTPPLSTPAWAANPHTTSGSKVDASSSWLSACAGLVGVHPSGLVLT